MTLYVSDNWENTETIKHDTGRSIYSIILLLKWIMHNGFIPGSKKTKE